MFGIKTRRLERLMGDVRLAVASLAVAITSRPWLNEADALKWYRRSVTMQNDISRLDRQVQELRTLLKVPELPKDAGPGIPGTDYPAFSGSIPDALFVKQEGSDAKKA